MNSRLFFKNTLGSFLFLSFLLAPSISAGQQSSDVNIRVIASVKGSIELITINSIDFRNAARVESVLTVDPLLSSGAGKMVAKGTPGSEFRLDYLRRRELTNAEGTGVLFLTYSVTGSNKDEQITAEHLNQEMRGLTFNSEGEFYIWIGGYVNLHKAEPGSYEGEFIIEIEYL